MNRKYKPALYELIGKGQLKPNGSGSMSTPSWFYTGKTKKNKKNAPESADSQSKNDRQKAFANIGCRLRLPNFTARLKEKRLEISTNFWVVSLVGLALVLSHLMSFMLGQRGAVETNGNPVVLAANVDISAAERNISDQLVSIHQSPVRQNIYPSRKKPSPLAKGPIATATPAQAISQKPPLSVVRANSVGESAMAIRLPDGGKCLVMCGHPDSLRVLRPVQEYFNKKGIPVEIGRFQGRYVVYTRQAFAKQSGSDAEKLKERITKAGMKYNHNKPKGALGFGAETFASAFAVNVNRIKNIDNR